MIHVFRCPTTWHLTYCWNGVGRRWSDSIRCATSIHQRFSKANDCIVQCLTHTRHHQGHHQTVCRRQVCFLPTLTVPSPQCHYLVSCIPSLPRHVITSCRAFIHCICRAIVEALNTFNRTLKEAKIEGTNEELTSAIKIAIQLAQVLIQSSSDDPNQLLAFEKAKDKVHHVSHITRGLHV